MKSPQGQQLGIRNAALQSSELRSVTAFVGPMWPVCTMMMAPNAIAGDRERSDGPGKRPSNDAPEAGAIENASETARAGNIAPDHASLGVDALFRSPFSETSHSAVDAIAQVNDAVLEPLVRGDRESAEQEIGRLVFNVAQPVIDLILDRYIRSGTVLSQDENDIAATIHLRLVEKLRRVRTDPEESIRDFVKYVAALTYNAVNDQLRQRFPQRARLKNRLRYTLTHDSRLALWVTHASQGCGLSSWRGTNDVAEEVPIDEKRLTKAMLNRDRPADALVAIFTAAGRPVSVDGLIDFTARIWHIVDTPLSDGRMDISVSADAFTQLESRELMDTLWSEIMLLRPLQRKALLLNLRDADTANVVSLLLLTGVATLVDLSAALEMEPDRLIDTWNQLPLDDRQIAELVGLTRQQVINLRKSARARLARRLKRAGA